MKRMLQRCAALDVHKKTVTACVRVTAAGGEREELMAEFSTMAEELLALRDGPMGSAAGCPARRLQHQPAVPGQYGLTRPARGV